MNVAHDVADELQKKTLPPTKLRWNLALGHQAAIAQSIKLVQGWRGQAAKFRVLLLATSLVVIFAGTNVYLESRAPHAVQPTHIVIDKDKT